MAQMEYPNFSADVCTIRAQVAVFLVKLGRVTTAELQLIGSTRKVVGVENIPGVSVASMSFNTGCPSSNLTPASWKAGYRRTARAAQTQEATRVRSSKGARDAERDRDDIRMLQDVRPVAA